MFRQMSSLLANTQNTPPMIRLHLIFLAASLCLMPVARAEFKTPELAPVDRLVASAEQYLTAHADEANAHYTLARVHYLAFSAKSDRVPSFGVSKEGALRIPERAMSKMRARANPVDKPAAELDAAQALAHMIAAEKSFLNALRIDGSNALYQLGLASLLDEGRTWLATAKPAGVPAEWQKVTVAKIREAYTKAFDLGLAKDSTMPTIPLLGLESITSYEAAQALVRLGEQDAASMTEADRTKLAEAKAAIAEFGKLRRGPVTPIVFALEPPRHLEELLANDVTVDFDLRGYGLAERWSWVKPELGFLVWDPSASSRIASARQLFGSYTFEIFRETGYDALAALDDDRDGQLTGAELAGVRVWFDRNSDGVSTAAEVVSLDALGITAISTSACAKDGIHPMNPTGITLGDRRTLPTWDWIAAPCAAPAEKAGKPTVSLEESCRKSSTVLIVDPAAVAGTLRVLSVLHDDTGANFGKDTIIAADLHGMVYEKGHLYIVFLKPGAKAGEFEAVPQMRVEDGKEVREKVRSLLQTVKGQ